jgi:NAD+ synthetase
MPRPLDDALLDVLARLRAGRGFDAAAWLRAKARLLNDYARASGLRAAVVGVSGGVDSAAALGVAARAAREPGSPLARVVGALLPVFVDEGATNQALATERGRAAVAAAGAACVEADLGPAVRALRGALEGGAGGAATAWSAGQLVSYARTPALYGLAALLGERGEPAFVVGTTNRDEGSYLGFFGKASDGMVDVQLLSDLHKSEVRAVARLVGVPDAIVDAVPTGDTYDGRVDEDMIGAPYDFVELYELWRCLRAEAPARAEALLAALPPGARGQWDAYRAAVDELHHKNRHKYLGASPALHFDVWPRAVPGGWRAEPPPAPPRPVDRSRFVAPFALPPPLVARLAAAPADMRRVPVGDAGDRAFVVEGVLSRDECAALLAAIARAPRLPVGRDGRASGPPFEGERAVSLRSSIYDESFAAALWARLRPALPALRVLGDDDEASDAEHARVFRAVGLSPLVRVLWGEPGSSLVRHHDEGYDFGDGERHTLMSVVLALGDVDAGEGGQTRLLLDPQRNAPPSERAYADGDDVAPPRDVLAAIEPRAGRALVFDHRLPHDAPPYRPRDGRPRVLLRADLVFARCGRLPDAGEPPEAPGAWAFRELGLPAPAPAREVDRATADALARAASAGERAELRARGKIVRDPFYARAFLALGSREAVEHAGWFDDGGPAAGDDDDPRRDRRWPVTPLDKIARRLEALGDRPGPLAVLVSTGSFCPVHRGHVEMMERAREAVEASGRHVLGGWLSVSHDDYVLAKCPGAPPAAHRLALCEAALRESDWLSVDPWEALYCRRALNFTDVLARLEGVLATQVRSFRPIEIVYVFGGDNARFALTFVGRGHGVCVPRPGSEAQVREAREHPLVRSNPRVLFAPAIDDATAAAASSTSVRAGAGHDALPDLVRRRWRDWQGAPRRVGARVIVRDEGLWPVEPWLRGRDRGALEAALLRFRAGVLLAIERAFRRARPPDAKADPDIQVVRLDDQRALAQGLGPAVVSLDPCVEAPASLRVSRCFHVGGAAEIGLVARPGAPPLDEQIAALPLGDVILLDDDRASGATLRAVEAMLGPTRRVTRTVTLADVSAARDDGDVGDLVDGRDFLAGAREAGLVLRLPDATLARAPYVLPWVRPALRLSTPPSTELALSREIWALNLAFFEALEPGLRVSDASNAFAALCDYLGFAPDAPLAEVCRWHLERLPLASPDEA